MKESLNHWLAQFIQTAHLFRNEASDCPYEGVTESLAHSIHSNGSFVQKWKTSDCPYKGVTESLAHSIPSNGSFDQKRSKRMSLWRSHWIIGSLDSFKRLIWSETKQANVLMRGRSHIAPKNAWKTLGAPLSPFFQSARAVALRRRLSLLSNHQLRSPHCSSYLSQNNEGLTSHKVQEIPGPQWWAAPPFFCWGFKVTEKVRKLIGWFLSHDLRCACGILKIWDVFISMRRGRAWKKLSRRTATASLPLWARIPRIYIWNNELERAKDAICERPLKESLNHWLTQFIQMAHSFRNEASKCPYEGVTESLPQSISSNSWFIQKWSKRMSLWRSHWIIGSLDSFKRLICSETKQATVLMKESLNHYLSQLVQTADSFRNEESDCLYEGVTESLTHLIYSKTWIH